MGIHKNIDYLLKICYTYLPDFSTSCYESIIFDEIKYIDMKIDMKIQLIWKFISNENSIENGYENSMIKHFAILLSEF